MSYTHLTREERYQIWAMLRTEHSVREIACTLDRSPSTISREIRRNSGRRGYRPKQAHDLAAARAHSSRRRRAMLISGVWSDLKKRRILLVDHLDDHNQQKRIRHDRFYP